MRRGAALVVAIGLVLGACSDDGPDEGADEGAGADAADRAAATTTAPGGGVEAWATIDAAVAEHGTHVGFLAARVTDDGCEAVHAVEPEAARPMGSQFKLLVLGALAEAIAEGRLAWDGTVTVTDEARSTGNGLGQGALQELPAGTEVPVQEAATKMIAISDNTAADLLLGLVGREAVEAQAAEWLADSAANVPFLTTRQMLLLHYVPRLADELLALPREERAAFLASSVDPRPLSDIGAGFTTEPRYVHAVEWFASPLDVCTTFAGLRAQAAAPALAPLDDVLSQQDVGLDLDPERWPTVWYKGGSEPGVLALGWLATNADGDTYVVQVMVSDPDAALADDAMVELIDRARDAFELLDGEHP